MTAGGRASRRHRRWPVVLVVLVLLAAALAVAAELVARAVLPGVVRSLVVEQLDLPADQQLDVEASGILLPQLIAGRLDRLRLSSERVTLEGVTGAADVTAQGVPLRGGDIGAAHGTVRIDQAQLVALLSRSDLPVTDVTLEEPNVTASGAITVFGADIPVSVTATPGADAGELVLTPVSVSVGGSVIDLAGLSGRLGDVGERLSAPQQVCIADRLPAGLILTGLRIEGESAVAEIDIDGRIATDPALLDPGTCP
ncbi:MULTISPECIES: DUF2993 domain-containing protein [Microbacterium]|uniref:DUF2993 domain-containing protein n=1 Tax=Microbacterium TaxID=33882 RepID=UPI00217D5013|nr:MULTISPECIES: DUF2993 domain-containing protein [Microbacterium]UWF78268.1 DUF2993 domain-containing protein [Microbacterium neungamense]WCM56442.1 DUF2993 domain-containing protein [Microbacterium sp. EF45047]